MAVLPRTACGAAVVGLLIAASVVTAADAAELVTKKSTYAVDETLDRLEDVLKDKGIPVMGRIDHRDNALTVGETLRATEVLIFGNPEIGTQLMQIEQKVGLDLPMRVLSWEGEDGQTWVGYHPPARLAEQYEALAAENDFLQKMSEALDNLTDAAIKQ